MTQAKPNPTPTNSALKPLLAGGLIFALVMIFLDVHGGMQNLLNNPSALMRSPLQNKGLGKLSNACTTDIADTARLSREQLLKLLAVPERDTKARVREITQEPYCQLSSLEIRAGVNAVREAYPLAFDPNTALVILYENDEYAGYRFKHQ